QPGAGDLRCDIPPDDGRGHARDGGGALPHGHPPGEGARTPRRPTGVRAGQISDPVVRALAGGDAPWPHKRLRDLRICGVADRVCRAAVVLTRTCGRRRAAAAGFYGRRWFAADAALGRTAFNTGQAPIRVVRRRTPTPGRP